MNKSIAYGFHQVPILSWLSDSDLYINRHLDAWEALFVNIFFYTFLPPFVLHGFSIAI